jgi:nucleotide-binding universal stress UspA family protein
MSTQHCTVVVGYDFSHSSEPALDRAVQLAGRAPEHVLHILCAIDPKHAIPSIPAYNGIDYLYASRVQEALAAEVHAACERAGITTRVTFFVHARIGKAAEEVLLLAREVGADLIIVGSHGLTGIERLVLGSVSERIVREAHCTVEVARKGEYPHVELMEVTEVPREGHKYVPPHRYEYEDHRVLLRPNDWPLL